MQYLELGEKLNFNYFFSMESTAEATKNQGEFVVDKFIPMINGLKSSVYVGKHSIGQMFGTLSRGNYFSFYITIFEYPVHHK